MTQKRVKKPKKISSTKSNYSLPFLGTKTLGQKAADFLTKWAGSWTFILTFLAFIFLWMIVNIYALIGRWDIYPFILLNLVLSCLAAIQAPIILMSQNRQSQIDRARSQYDYIVDKKAEQEIREIKKQLTRIETHILVKKN